MSASGIPRKPPPPPPLIVALLVLILIGVVYIAIKLNGIENIEQGRANSGVQVR